MWWKVLVPSLSKQISEIQPLSWDSISRAPFFFREQRECVTFFQETLTIFDLNPWAMEKWSVHLKALQKFLSNTLKFLGKSAVSPWFCCQTYLKTSGRLMKKSPKILASTYWEFYKCCHVLRIYPVIQKWHSWKTTTFFSNRNHP